MLLAIVSSNISHEARKVRRETVRVVSCTPYDRPVFSGLPLSIKPPGMWRRRLVALPAETRQIFKGTRIARI